jgi:hypothetical protein
MKVNGGYVKKVFQSSKTTNGTLASTVRVLGVWSGGNWKPGDNVIVTQFRGDLNLGLWQLVAVERVSSFPVNIALVLRPLQLTNDPLQESDILLLGEGYYTRIEVNETSLPLQQDAAIEVGPERIPGVAMLQNNIVPTIFIFHAVDSTLPTSEELPVWWRGKQFQLRIATQKPYVLEVIFENSKLLLQELLTTLDSFRSFILDAGQEIIFRQPAGRGTRSTRVTNGVEPTVTVGPGSVKVFLHPAQPHRRSLLAPPEAPLKLLYEVLQASERGDTDAVVRILSEKILSTDAVLRKLAKIGEAAAKHGKIRVKENSRNSHYVSVDSQTSAVAKQSLESLDQRVEQREGMLFALEHEKGWCRLRVNKPGADEIWNLTVPKDLRSQVQGKIPRFVRVDFLTRTRPNLRKGLGEMTRIVTISEDLQINLFQTEVDL